MTNPPEDKERADASASTIVWPICTQLPANPGVRLIFAGLMGVLYNPTTKYCEVGFYRGAGVHAPEIIIYERPGVCRPNKLTAGTGRMTVGIDRQPANVCFFKQNPGVQLHRYSANTADIRWMIDLNAPDWYPHATTIPPGFFAPVLEVKQGTFYTIQKTNSTFNRVDRTGTMGPERFGYMSRFIAADIELSGSQSVSLNTGSITTVLRPTQQRTYEVLFTNLCPSNHASDFHLLVETIAGASDPVYDFAVEIEGPPAHPHFCTVGSELDPNIHAASDDAPCMAGGFGGAGGFPGPS